MQSAALNTGAEYHGLDHIAPLADLRQMPLIIEEERNFDLARKYYPMIPIRHMPDIEFRLGEIADEFDTLFECKYWAPHLKALFRELYQKEMRLVFCPHGQSDKGFQAPLLAPYALQDAVLLYGNLMIEMLKELGVWSSISQYEVVGNYRLKFYQKHRLFYDRLVSEEIPLERSRMTLLYAPTWRDADDSTSYFKYGAELLSQLPSSWNLIIKPHPLLELRDPSYFYAIQALATKRENVIWLDEFPLVYPLLSIADAYLGDASSVGYDFLFFQKPLYFFPTRYKGRLQDCGQIIDPSRNFFSQIDLSDRFKDEQKKLYSFAFSDL